MLNENFVSLEKKLQFALFYVAWRFDIFSSCGLYVLAYKSEY